MAEQFKKIEFLASENVFLLHTVSSTYAMGVHTDGTLLHLHWGGIVEHPNDLPAAQELARTTTLAVSPQTDCREYIEWGRGTPLEPSLQVRFSDGTRGLTLVYRDHTVSEENNGAQTLSITLGDTVFPLEVRLTYTVFYDLDIIQRSAAIVNRGEDPVFLDRAYSASFILPVRDAYRVTNFGGAWAAEYQMQQQMLTQTQLVMQSRTGLSGPEYAPFFMIDGDAAATENSGFVYFGTLIWSGNWKIQIEKDSCNRTVISGGINEFDFSWKLEQGECFETPVFAAGYTQGGFGAVSRQLHRYQKEHIMSSVERSRTMPLIYNAYGTFLSAINEEKMLSIIDTAAELGVELFVMDAGWTGEGDDTTLGYRHGFGDWTVNPDRFPHGLRMISDKIHSRGMKFGIWMEPEAVSPESQLFKDHPDWVHKYPGRETAGCEVRHTLNFAVEEAAEFMTNRMIDLIRELKLDYFKMDFCKFSACMAWQNCNLDRQKEVWVRHTRNLYRCYERVKAEFPDILIENCASGGFRADLGMLRFSGRMNRSDNQDPMDILKLHEGFSYFLLPKLAGGGCHISDMFTKHINGRNSAMKFQALVGMLGSLAIGKNLNTVTPDEMRELKGYTALYKEIRDTVQHGSLYRLASPRKKPYAVFQYISDDERELLVFAFSQSMQFAKMPERIYLEGLEADALYESEEYGVRSGNGLMHVGLQIPLRGDMDCRLIRFQRK